MKFQPLGIVYSCNDYAQTPTPLVLSDRVRIFVAARDAEGKSYVRYVDLDLDDPTKILEVSGQVLGRGHPGCFDQDGAMPSFAKIDGHSVKLIYSGWTACQTTPYHNATGVAFSDNGGRGFYRKHDGPTIDRSAAEPYLRVTAMRHGFNTYYVSGLRWVLIDGKHEPIYVIRSLTSIENPIVIKQQWENECFSRPWAFDVKGETWMLYSYRDAYDYRDGKNAYRLGLANQYGDNLWRRCDDLLDLPRTPGFDDTMQCYAATFEVKGKVYMIYNGSGFGRHGFALAVLT